jgi:hypothetical protein
MAETTKFTIYRDSWLRGKFVQGESRLHRKYDNRMCCIGQMACQAGTRLAALTGVSTLDSLLPVDTPESLLFLVDADVFDYRKSSTTASDAMNLNDDDVDYRFTEAQREEELTRLFSKNNIELTFVDGVAPWFKEATA